MSLVAAIDTPKNISVWSKSVSSLAAILEHIRFTVCETHLILLAVNSSRTTNGEIVFTTQFFRELTFSTEGITHEGLDADEVDFALSKYSFVVSSRHMVMLFKNIDSSNLNYICLRVECRSDTPMARKYKLMVEVLTKKLIVKKFHMNYQPVTGDLNEIVSKYKSEYEEGYVHHFLAETATFKLFLDMVSVATEDFSIEAKQSKIVFGAYTKQILKDREFLKQPMLVTILMSTEELMDTNLGDVDVVVNFRLKDIRNFITLCTGLKSDTSDAEVLGLEPNFDAYFKQNGDPIVFEYKNSDLIATFIQITAEDPAKPELKSDGKSAYALPAPNVQKIVDSTGSRYGSDISGVSNTSRRVILKSNTLDLGNPQPSVFQSNRTEEPEDFDSFRYSNSPQTVTYGKRASTPINESAKRSRADTDYSTSDEEAPGEFGPTQHDTYKPQSLFD